ncbi:hypothetical protein [Streptomyces himalayensis]|uniref:Thymidylate kinase n=1 Tax=Streptomyces himalayensis subsp. himalayensis TaxID=2756131 RepID=A0A7W0IBX2_9ACTN|nr:hypothetical protein [Streptomyces himalayensis]MBA2949579.1 hypothetical protein [Streptomyces himalayensis subsp. himalayensis]
MTIIALEGPSYAGKTTVLQTLRAIPALSKAVFFDCYVKSILHPESIPEARTGSTAEQLTAFAVFMGIEAQRVTAVTRRPAAPVILLDRSVDTLMAHARALDELAGYTAYPAALRHLQQLPHLRPDLTIYLDASPESLHLRRKHAGHTTTEPHYFLHDDDFLSLARSYFLNGKQPVITRRLEVVSADQPPEDVAQAVTDLVLNRR